MPLVNSALRRRRLGRLGRLLLMVAGYQHSMEVLWREVCHWFSGPCGDPEGDAALARKPRVSAHVL